MKKFFDIESNFVRRRFRKFAVLHVKQLQLLYF